MDRFIATNRADAVHQTHVLQVANEATKAPVRQPSSAGWLLGGSEKAPLFCVGRRAKN